MKKICVVFGTRPEAIKMAPVIKALHNRQEIEYRVCVTAQHREMLDQVLKFFNIVPDKDLNLMRSNQSLADLTARSLSLLNNYFSAEKPDAILVQGDTTTVLAASIAAFYNKIPIGHIEAGLRTYNLYSPWPEEANRVLTTRLAKWHFAPTKQSKNNLLQEGIKEDNIFLVGNTVIDALYDAINKITTKPVEILDLPKSVLEAPNDIILITGHRRENFGTGMRHICHALAYSAKKYPQTNFIYPVHLNPNVQKPVLEILGPLTGKNIFLIPPQDYPQFVTLMNRAKFIITDSGGIQEEAPSIGKPVLVTRETTERPEAVLAGGVKLVGTNEEQIIESIDDLQQNDSLYKQMSLAKSPYGDGKSGARIIDIICRLLNEIK